MKISLIYLFSGSRSIMLQIKSKNKTNKSSEIENEEDSGENSLKSDKLKQQNSPVLDDLIGKTICQLFGRK